MNPFRIWTEAIQDLMMFAVAGRPLTAAEKRKIRSGKRR
jgi:hypothetical protein